MASHGSPTFEMYSRNLQRIFWAEFIDVQTQLTRVRKPDGTALLPPIVADAAEPESLSPTYEYYRHRSFSGS